MKRYAITGGAGFVGSSIAIALKMRCDCEVLILDNLLRRGSELNIDNLKNHGIKFIHGDVRNYDDIKQLGNVDFLFECSAEPSVLAGANGSPNYVINTNLNGAINCAEFCKKYNSGLFFLSTSRVYPIQKLNEIKLRESSSRFELSKEEQPYGVSKNGITENLSLVGARSFYGASKLAAENILEEYRYNYDFPIIINRSGVIAGPGQFGKIDQGIIAFWLAAHFFKKDLSYIGFNGSGKQVRDILHIDDLIEIVMIQINNPTLFSKDIYNIGGGLESSCSLLELTSLCKNITKQKIGIKKIKEKRYGDIPFYISDTNMIFKKCKWLPKNNLTNIVEDLYKWLVDNKNVQDIIKKWIL